MLGIASGRLKGQVNTEPMLYYFRWLIPPSLLLVECIFHVELSTNERRVHICHYISHTFDFELEEPMPDCALPGVTRKLIIR